MHTYIRDTCTHDHMIPPVIPGILYFYLFSGRLAWAGLAAGPLFETQFTKNCVSNR